MEPLHGICEGVSWGEAKWGSGQAAQERRKLGVRLREEAAFFNNIFHRCCHLSTIWLQNGNCSPPVRTEVGRRAWRKSLGQWVKGSLRGWGMRDFKVFIRDESQGPWTARRLNQSILKKINPQYLLEGLMLKLKLQYFGRPMQRANSLEKTLMLRMRMRWLDGSNDSMDKS